MDRAYDQSKQVSMDAYKLSQATANVRAIHDASSKGQDRIEELTRELEDGMYSSRTITDMQWRSATLPPVMRRRGCSMSYRTSSTSSHASAEMTFAPPRP